MRVRDIWTLPQVIRLGLLASLAAVLLWPAHAVSPERVRPAFVAALALVALCGVSILLMSLIDLLTVTRDRRILPARVFDLLLGLALMIPSVLARSTCSTRQRRDIGAAADLSQRVMLS